MQSDLVEGDAGDFKLKELWGDVKIWLKGNGLRHMLVNLIPLSFAGIMIVFLGLIMAITDYKIKYYEFGMVHLKFDHEENDAMKFAMEEEGLLTPSTFGMKMIAVYLANDIDGYVPGGRVRYGMAPEGYAEIHTQNTIIENMKSRMLYFNPVCDPDGDGEIDDCDTASQWKFPNQVRKFFQLGLDTTRLNEQINAQIMRVDVGEYRYVIVQTCLDNYAESPMFSARGATMEKDLLFAHPDEQCFHVISPFDRQNILNISHGEAYTITLQYTTRGTMTALNEENGERIHNMKEWNCEDTSVVGQRYCVMIPEFNAMWEENVTWPGSVTQFTSGNVTSTGRRKLRMQTDLPFLE